VFIIHLERDMDANKDLKGGITVHGVSINNLRFADDIDLIEASSSSLQEAAAIGPSHKQSKDTDNIYIYMQLYSSNDSTKIIANN